MTRRHGWLVSLLVLAAPLAAQRATVPEGAPGSVVRAVLFYSPLCPHCHELTTVELPPLLEHYGDRLRIVAVNTMAPRGQALYQATVQRFAIAAERRGVPTLVVGSRVLVGTDEIPRELPAIVDHGLASGGIDWPDIPSLREALGASSREEPAPAAPAAAAAERAPGPPPGPESAAAAAAAAAGPTGAEEARPPTRRATEALHAGGPGLAASAAPVHVAAGEEAPAAGSPVTGAERAGASLGPGTGELSVLAAGSGGPTTAAPPLSPGARFRLDPVGNSVAVALLLLMVAALFTVASAWTGRRARIPPPPRWLIPLLAVAGLGIATYLTFVEVSGTRAICGPVGHCNVVQQSTFAWLFGRVPVGLLGAAGYATLLALWGLVVAGPLRTRAAGRRAIRGLALLATLFSSYLTFLEPFVIGATCAWCLASAVITTLILLAATGWVTQADASRPLAHREAPAAPTAAAGR